MKLTFWDAVNPFAGEYIRRAAAKTGIYNYGGNSRGAFAAVLYLP